MDYLIGGGLVWMISGILNLFSFCLPAHNDDSWVTPPLSILLISIVLGPFVGVAAIRSMHETYFNGGN